MRYIQGRADGCTKRGLGRQGGGGSPAPSLGCSANQPGEAAGTGRASRVTQRRVVERDPDPLLLWVAEGEVSGK